MSAAVGGHRNRSPLESQRGPFLRLRSIILPVAGAIAGWPLGKPVRHGKVTMTNLIGDDINDYGRWLTEPGATVHLYGKGPPRPGRKMGHVTRIG